MCLLEDVEVVAVTVETHKEFLVSHVSFFSSGELLPDLIGVAGTHVCPTFPPGLSCIEANPPYVVQVHLCTSLKLDLWYFVVVVVEEMLF
uniref:Uncharacterized protein n=1 Tax=Tanacetum cinerariifolium TaxID=118510 RepID=A0A699UQH8_TANCI|nr:hypothetical protein [Tanacetum cinerariifolium]